MTDITMCHGEHCKRRDKCFRFTAKADVFRQSYFTKSPVDTKDGSCEFFWPLHGWEPEQNEDDSEYE